ncbi:unnamed protein product [Acanthoscelides obtectus]|uniref:Uncharacterized protein n=1 Tax=Acanthoscelides obtectus TaxID=200917 RepID=A0A9P0KRU9_ACAOB|nr:unnamed protein product [Acanthoscelides obtectus]CAK1677353.1 hypothetical protein AOBTE_LOCUS31262 [Acanthoscelides obtectus]
MSDVYDLSYIARRIYFSGSVEMNDQSSMGSATTPQSRAVSVEAENRTGSLSSDEGVQPIPPDGHRAQPSTSGQASGKGPSKTPSFKNRLLHKTPNTLSVQPYGSLGQSLPNLTLGSPNVGVSPGGVSFSQNTLSVPGKNSSQLLSPTHRGISYPPPSPTRGNLRRSLAISTNKNPPLIKTRQVNSASASVSQQNPASFDFDVPVIAGVSQDEEHCEFFNRGHHRQAMKRTSRYHTAGIVDDIKKQQQAELAKDSSIHKRLSWNFQQPSTPPLSSNQEQT